ncbi:MAG: hypothetical protein ACHQ9S_07570 [Candidatus Binatia bacterium]
MLQVVAGSQPAALFGQAARNGSRNGNHAPDIPPPPALPVLLVSSAM